MTEQLDVQQMAQRLLAADNILILCHKNPDGDTIGCGSALYYALKALEKTTAVLCSDAIPSRYAFTNPRLFKGEFEPRTVIAVDVAKLAGSKVLEMAEAVNPGFINLKVSGADRKSTRLNSSHKHRSRMPSSA